MRFDARATGKVGFPQYEIRTSSGWRKTTPEETRFLSTYFSTEDAIEEAERESHTLDRTPPDTASTFLKTMAFGLGTNAALLAAGALLGQPTLALGIGAAIMTGALALNKAKAESEAHEQQRDQALIFELGSKNNASDLLRVMPASLKDALVR